MQTVVYKAVNNSVRPRRGGGDAGKTGIIKQFERLAKHCDYSTEENWCFKLFEDGN